MLPRNVPNRNKLRKAREAVKALPPKQREALRWAGIGPGESYLGVWRFVTHFRHRLTGVQSAMAREDISPSALRELKEEERYLYEQIIRMYVKLLPHEQPRLQSIEFKGDPNNPPEMEPDLKKLTDEELRVLSRILPKLGGANGQQPDQGGAGAGNVPSPADRSRRRA
jgi:hypothetical protein